MGEWELTVELRERVQPLVEEYINWLEEYKQPEDRDEGLHLSHTGISPVQLEELLEKLGYEPEAIDTNGWECDYCWYMTHPNKDNDAKELCICGTAMCHDIYLRIR